MAEYLKRRSLGVWETFVEQVQLDMCEQFQVNRTFWVRGVAAQTLRGARETFFKHKFDFYIIGLHGFHQAWQACQIWWVVGYVTSPNMHPKC